MARNFIQKLRKGLGMTQAELAERINADPESDITNADASLISKIELGKVRLSDKYIGPIARALDASFAELLGEDPSAKAVPNRPVVRSSVRPVPEKPSTSPAPVPVYGTAAGSAAGTLTLTTEVIEWAKRPEALAGKKDIYALYVVGTSMEPRYYAGDIVFVDPHRPPRAGDDVIVQTRDNGTDGTQAALKRYERSTATTVVTTQFNPPDTIEFPLENVKAVHRVLTRNEIAGV
ncbi:XRE family transcriptional regulator [Oricola thermophila]|uniref:Helix-turn-helix domain-containing protein n=1 Tax=Oricola thermophila TaxID=2742145 RepID=A0A6N1VDY0_9HYPH|nr:LexA family transcriptional regulator [Oricola thermophila]QKV18743.1 helix-turn-helix domain-containing protein [Oricola thermophila]